MAKSKSPSSNDRPNPEEKKLIEGLRRHPALMERMHSIMDLADNGQATADEIEALLVEEVRRLGANTMESWANSAEQQSAKEFKQQNPKSRYGKKKRLSWLCVFGRVSVVERVWRTPSSSYEAPLAQRIGVRSRSPSKRLRRVLSDFGIDASFAKAATKVQEHYGFDITARAVRKATLESAFQAAQHHCQQEAQGNRLLPTHGQQTLIAEADGSFIRTVEPGSGKGKRPRQWEEIRLAAVQVHGQEQCVYGVSFGAPEELGRRWGHCAKQAGRGLDSRIHCVGDGAVWIELQHREVFGPQGSYLVDFFHVSEYLAAVAPTCRPHAPESWRKTQHKRLKRGDLKRTLKDLAAHLEATGTPDEEAPVRTVHRYLSNRADQLDYPQALAHGLPIGSGLIESGHKHVLQARLKLPGCAWLKKNASDMAQLRALRANDQWEEIWN